MPIPGDEVMGYHSAGRGIVVHRMDCANVAEYRAGIRSYNFV